MTRGLGLSIIGLSLFSLVGCDQIEGRMAAKRGHDTYLAKQFNESIENYEAAHLNLPQNQMITRNLGFAYLAASREELSKEKAKTQANKSIDLLSQLLNQNPKDTELAAILLDAWEQTGRLEEAAKFFKTRLATNANDVEALRGLGVVELKRGNFAAALDVYEKRKQLNPNETQVYGLIAETTWQWLRAKKADELSAPVAVELATRGIEAAMEGSSKDKKDTSLLVFARLLIMERLELQKDNPALVEKDRLLVEDINKKIDALVKSSNAPKAGKDAKP